MRSNSSQILFRVRSQLLFAGLTGLLSVSYGQTPAPKKEISDRTSEELGKVRTASDAKNFDAALDTLNKLLPSLDPNSYDFAVVNQIRAQLFLQKNEYSKAIEPLEASLQLADRFGYFDERQTSDTIYYLAQLYYQDASTLKGDPARVPFQKAASYMERYIKIAKKPNPDSELFYASLLFNMAQIDPNNVDLELIRRARTEAEKGLYTAVRPKENIYLLILASHQQLGELAPTADLLELLVKQYPANKQYWQNLASTYLNLAGETKDPEKSQLFNLRAITAIERAQKHGVMTTPKDQFNLISIYFNIQQFEKATELLDAGLHDGTIENDPKNWELLAYSLQQLRREFKAIDILKEATQLFPENAQLEYLIAQLFYSLDKPDEALVHLQRSVAKGAGEKPAQVYLFLAYVGFELKKFDIAKGAIDKASGFPEISKEVERMKRAITDAETERQILLEGTASKK